jgi:AmmeMemoRadiSam system protein A
MARAAIERALGADVQHGNKALWLDAPAATFITLTKAGELRGCIGSLTAHRSLAEDIAANAVAAMRDPRFAPVTREEMESIDIEVSLLTTPQPFFYLNEESAIAQLVPGEDGLVFEAEGKRATYLPQVWEQLPDPRDFLRELKVKAGLPADYWSADVRLLRYGALKFKEEWPA